MSSAKWWPFCSGGDELRSCIVLSAEASNLFKHQGLKKWQTFCRWHFLMHFWERKCGLIQISLKCSILRIPLKAAISVYGAIWPLLCLFTVINPISLTESKSALVQVMTPECCLCVCVCVCAHQDLLGGLDSYGVPSTKILLKVLQWTHERHIPLHDSPGIVNSLRPSDAYMRR